MQFDHVAVSSSDIARSVEWYRQRFAAEVLYQDATWALLRVGGLKLALVMPAQHPPHVAMRVDVAQLEEAARTSKTAVETHRDGTRGIYLHDPSGNAVELICYPARP